MKISLNLLVLSNKFKNFNKVFNINCIAYICMILFTKYC